jgi:hypothetical protein
MRMMVHRIVKWTIQTHMYTKWTIQTHMYTSTSHCVSTLIHRRQNMPLTLPTGGGIDIHNGTGSIATQCVPASHTHTVPLYGLSHMHPSRWLPMGHTPYLHSGCIQAALLATRSSRSQSPSLNAAHSARATQWRLLIIFLEFIDVTHASGQPHIIPPYCNIRLDIKHAIFPMYCAALKQIIIKRTSRFPSGPTSVLRGPDRA